MLVIETGCYEHISKPHSEVTTVALWRKWHLKRTLKEQQGESWRWPLQVERAWMQDATWCFAGNCEEFWMLEHDCKDVKKQTFSANSVASFHQTTNRQCVCVCVCVCLCVHVSLILCMQKHDVRILAKYSSCKSMDNFTYVNKHNFQIIVHYQFQFIYILGFSQNLGKPQLMSVCFDSEQTFLFAQYRLAESEKGKWLFLPRPNHLSRSTVQTTKNVLLEWDKPFLYPYFSFHISLFKHVSCEE